MMRLPILRYGLVLMSVFYVTGLSAMPWKKMAAGAGLVALCSLTYAWLLGNRSNVQLNGLQQRLRRVNIANLSPEGREFHRHSLQAVQASFQSKRREVIGLGLGSLLCCLGCALMAWGSIEKLDASVQLE